MERRQITDTLMMIRPLHFGYNEETAANNAFQSDDSEMTVEQISEKAIAEFDVFVNKLRNAGVTVEVIEDSAHPPKPDSVFPNNWISFHQSGGIITYPMFSKIRREERREDIVDLMTEKYRFTRRFSFEYYEEDEMYLEGTGSLVLDRVNKIAYACHSVRTEARILDKWAILNGYDTVLFHANDREGNPIYHTNVMMAMGKDYVVVCSESISKDDEKKELINSFKNSNKQIIDITYNQLESFAGNMLLVRGRDADIIVMSSQAYNSLEQHQIDILELSSTILHSDISTIEKFGGGSVRCMMAEVFVPV